MALSAAWQIPFSLAAASAAATADTPSIPVVVLTGLSLVFGILIILYIVLTIEGKIFTEIDRKKKEKQEEEKQREELAKAAPAQEQVAAIAAVAQYQSGAEPGVQAGIPPEVVAAIAAAVAAESEGQYTLESISAAPQLQKAPDRRGRWGFAGVIADTEPF